MTRPDPPQTQDAVLAVKDLVKAFDRGAVRALNGLSLTLEPGCHGLLGANGAGKSTFIKTCLGLIKPDSGSGEVLGHDIRTEGMALRARVGYMPERDSHVPQMSAVEYVGMFGELSGLAPALATKRAHEVLTYVGLEETRYRSVDGFSAGMRQRLKLATAIVHDPDLLFLDEPTNGLDPDGRRYMLDLIAELARSGVTLVLCTHLLPDVQEVCQTVVVTAAGRVVRQGTVAELTRAIASQFEVRFVGEAEPFLAALHARRADAEYDLTSGRTRVTLPDGADTELILDAAIEADVGLKHLVPGTRTLEEVFLESIVETPHAHS